MIDVLKIIKLNLFKIWLIMLWCFLVLSPSLNADTLDEVLRLTFSTNKFLLIFWIQILMANELLKDILIIFH